MSDHQTPARQARVEPTGRAHSAARGPKPAPPPSTTPGDLWGRILIAAMLLTGLPIAAQLAHATLRRVFGS